MKHYLLLLCTALFMSIYSQVALGGSDYVKGIWGDDRIRTIIPQAPVVSLEGNVLSVYCVDTLSDLSIKIIDSNGIVVLDKCVAISSDESENITLNEPGTYEIILVHVYGYLSGDFTIE